MSYASWASSIAEELLQSLSEADIEFLRSELNDMGIDQLFEWQDRFESDTLDFLESTPSERAKKKKWSDQRQRCLLTLNAYRLGNLAAEVLADPICSADTLGYREATRIAAALGARVIERGQWQWPFPDSAPDGWPQIAPITQHRRPTITVTPDSLF